MNDHLAVQQSPAVVVIGPQFCAGSTIDLTIVRKMLTLSEGNFGVTDVNGNIMFKVKGKLFRLRERRVLLDAAGNPIVTFQQKLMSARGRWRVFRGESADKKDLIFSVRKSSLLRAHRPISEYIELEKHSRNWNNKLEYFLKVRLRRPWKTCLDSPPNPSTSPDSSKTHSALSPIDIDTTGRPLSILSQLSS